MAKAIIQCRNLHKIYDDETILHNLNLNIENGTFTTILGPSGCGKTTLLRLISGFEQPNHGQILIQNNDVTDLSPQKRNVNTVFQSYALFPHMTVYENIAFGLRCEHLPKDEISQRVNDILKIVKLEKLKNRKPSQLSGGQQQRTAIARAAIKKPLVLLLDEPLSALDYRLRKTMQMELKNLQHELEMTFVFVTHDQEEALSLSDYIVVMDHGEIQQLGTPREIYEDPANLTVAKFIGETNIFPTEITQATHDTLTVKIEGFEYQLKNKNNFSVGDKVCTLIRPEDLRVLDSNEAEDKTSMIPGIVTQVNYKGSTVDLIVELDSGLTLFATEFFDEDDEELDYHLNERVWVKWHPGWEVILADED